MDPPTRSIKRRAVSAQTIGTSLSENRPPVGSLSSSNPKYGQLSLERQPPRPRNQKVSVGWVEGNSTSSRRTSSLQFEVAECVETKTITTTTTTKRSYPPLLIRQRLDELDVKEYPLAMKPPPAELLNFTYEVDEPSTSRHEASNAKLNFPAAMILDDPSSKGPEPAQDALKLSKPYKNSTGEKADQQRAERISQKLAVINQRRSAKGVPEVRFKTRRSLKNVKQEPQDSEDLETQIELLNRQNEQRRRNHGLGMHLSQDPTFPATPDMSELDVSNDRTQPSATSFFDSTYTPHSGLSQNDSFEDAPSPPETSNQDTFANAVATPPIAESDLEPLDGTTLAYTPVAAQRPTLNTAAAQNASLPSPGLSPTFASAHLHHDLFPQVDTTKEDGISAASPATQAGDSQETFDSDEMDFSDSQALRLFQRSSSGHPSVLDAQSMLESFDAMPNDMKTMMMFQFLRRCSRKTLHVIADVVNPALKCDFLDQLPTELSLHILSFLDHKDLCRAAQVSKRWRDITDSNETGWKELFDKDGFVLPAGELEKAIHQGWGWQDPHGPDGAERDLSVPPEPTAIEANPAGPLKIEAGPSRKGRAATKRKRAPTGSGAERAKRRSLGHEFADKAQGMIARYSTAPKFSKSEGPLSSANAAALAVPNPEIGLPNLRKLHLYKSLYRRHYMLQQSWMSGKVAPHHFAFPAHPAHVITCLQFDDDKILTGSDDTLIHVYDTKTGELRKKLEGHEGGVWALQYEGNVLVSGSTDRSVRVWDIEKGLCTQVFHGHTSTVRCLQILMPEMTGKTEQGEPIMVPPKPLIITGSRDSQLRVWKLPEQGSKRYIQTGPPANDADCPYFVRVLAGHLHSVRAIAAHQDTLVSGSYDNTVRVWKISTGETIHRLQGHAMKVYSVVLDHKRNRCISGSMDTFVKIWSLETGACLFTLEGHSSLVGLLDLSDERLVSAAADSTLRIWDPENGQCKSTLSAHTGAITCFQHDGQKVISGSDRTLKLWNIKTGECIKDLLTDLSGVWQVKFDERRCVAAVQRDNLTYVEVLDFGASRDGVPSWKRGPRRLLAPDAEAEADLSIVEEVLDD
ncbi:related to cell division control protein CDC4 [Phialocephala subalpina]|uniref:Related to cell division control protein CDC4 n=1 Tax=Phialocephala subalpina TaxID=576137 RepID=A0A1L7WWI5_9HELO|nr:related to cell division control protein CDC4 [Phialocephala subalpina]